MKSLRGQLIAFWLILLAACLALGATMLVLFKSSAGAVIAEAQTSAEGTCRTLATRYARSLADASRAEPQVDLLNALLQLVLIQAPHVEGGAWSGSGGFLAYAYPTYEGSGVKRDIPEAEAPHIVEIAQLAARTQAPQIDTVRGSREALIVAACPLVSPRHDLVAWTMTRAAAGTLEAQGSLRAGLGALLFVIVASGLGLGTILLRGYRHVQRLEATLIGAEAGGDAVPLLARTGLLELDRVVDAFNHYRDRFQQVQSRAREAERRQAHDRRLASLGRMTGSIAHEIRNPIAAMRLKAENALAAAPERQSAALRVILGQIARLDGLVQSLLAIVQPLRLELREVDVPAWLAERVESIATSAVGGVRIEWRADPMTARFDPSHLARAVDNLLDNALRHSAEGGIVRLSAAMRDATHWLLRVDDDGPGVPEALRSQLFEPFVTGRAEGTGLGLALAREVAFAHGGDLRYEPLAHGSRFELELPWHAC